MLDIAFAKPALPKSGALALLIHEGEKPSGLWEQLDEATGGAISRALEVADFKGGKGKTCTILSPDATITRVIAVGLGKPAEVTQKILEEAGGTIVSGLPSDTTVAVTCSAMTARHAAEVALGAVLRGYRFDRYRTKEKPEDKPKLEKMTVLTGRGRQGQDRVGAALCHRKRRLPDTRPGQRAPQCPQPGRDGGALPQTDRARP